MPRKLHIDADCPTHYPPGHKYHGTAKDEPWCLMCGGAWKMTDDVLCYKHGPDCFGNIEETPNEISCRTTKPHCEGHCPDLYF